MYVAGETNRENYVYVHPFYSLTMFEPSAPPRSSTIMGFIEPVEVLAFLVRHHDDIPWMLRDKLHGLAMRAWADNRRIEYFS